MHRPVDYRKVKPESRQPVVACFGVPASLHRRFPLCVVVILAQRDSRYPQPVSHRPLLVGFVWKRGGQLHSRSQPTNHPWRTALFLHVHGGSDRLGYGHVHWPGNCHYCCRRGTMPVRGMLLPSVRWWSEENRAGPRRRGRRLAYVLGIWAGRVLLRVCLTLFPATCAYQATTCGHSHSSHPAGSTLDRPSPVHQSGRASTSRWSWPTLHGKARWTMAAFRRHSITSAPRQARRRRPPRRYVRTWPVWRSKACHRPRRHAGGHRRVRRRTRALRHRPQDRGSARHRLSFGSSNSTRRTRSSTRHSRGSTVLSSNSIRRSNSTHRSSNSILRSSNIVGSLVRAGIGVALFASKTSFGLRPTK